MNPITNLAAPRVKINVMEIPYTFFSKNNYTCYRTSIDGAALNSQALEKGGKSGENPLMLAIFHNNVELVSVILSRPRPINHCDTEGRTALRYAVDGFVKKTAFLEKLLEAGADVNICDDKGVSPLYALMARKEAIENQERFESVVELLVQKGAIYKGPADEEEVPEEILAARVKFSEGRDRELVFARCDQNSPLAGVPLDIFNIILKKVLS